MPGGYQALLGNLELEAKLGQQEPKATRGSRDSLSVPQWDSVCFGCVKQHVLCLHVSVQYAYLIMTLIKNYYCISAFFRVPLVV